MSRRDRVPGRRARALLAFTGLLVMAVVPSGEAAPSPAGIAFTDQRPIATTSDELPRVDICNLTGSSASPRVFVTSVAGSDVPLAVALSPKNLPAGECGTITVAYAEAKRDVAFDGALVATLADTLITRPLTVAVADPAGPPAPPNDTVTLRATAPGRNAAAALPGDALVPVALDAEPDEVRAPAIDTAIGLLQHGSSRVTVFVNGEPDEWSPGVVSLPIRASGFAEIGDYTGSLNVASGADDPIMIELTVHSTRKNRVKWFFIVAGVVLGAVAAWYAQSRRPRQRLRARIDGVAPALGAAVRGLNGGPAPNPDPPFTIDKRETKKLVRRLRRLRTESFAFGFVDPKRRAYKELLEALDGADKNTALLRGRIATKLATLRHELDGLESAYPPAPAMPVGRPLFVAQLATLARKGRPLGPSSAAGLETSLDAALGLVSAWKKRAELWAALAGQADAASAQDELSTARRLLVGAADRELDSGPIDAALGRAWFLISQPPPPRAEEADVIGIREEAGPTRADQAPALVLPATIRTTVGSGLLGPIRDLATVGGSLASSLLIVLALVSAWYLSIETVIDDETFGSVGDYVRALGLAGVFSAALTTAIAAANSAVRAEPDST